MNFVERHMGILRDRLRITRGFNTVPSARKTWKIFPVYYNFIKPHSGIENKTPSEACGFNKDIGYNKWKGLIELANKNKS